MASNKTQTLKDPDKGVVRKAWEPMTLAYMGEARDVVQGGGGKLTATQGDPGEPRKVPSS